MYKWCAALSSGFWVWGCPTGQNQGSNISEGTAQYIEDFENAYVNRRGGRKRCTNEKSNWNEPIFGIGHQKFADKSIDKINFADLNDYWELLDAKGKKIGSDMSKAKKSKVTVINKLFERARIDRDFPDLKIVIG